MRHFAKLRTLCLAILIPIFLSSCSGDEDDLKGYWHIDEKGCLTLCAFTVYSDKKTGNLMLKFDDDGEIAHYAHGKFVKAVGDEYHLVFASGGKINFMLHNGTLVAEEGSVFEKITRKVETP